VSICRSPYPSAVEEALLALASGAELETSGEFFFLEYLMFEILV
jgi:hypothetical protein